MIAFRCSVCDEEMEIADRMAGKTIECVGCGRKVEVPDEAPPLRRREKSRRRRRQGGGQLGPAELRQVAMYQRAVIMCILIQVLLGVLCYAFSDELRTIPVAVVAAVAVILAVFITAAIFVFKLASRLYGSVALAMAVVTLVPFLGMLILVVVNQRATGVLKQEGYTVGFLGAPMSQFEDEEDEPEDDE